MNLSRQKKQADDGRCEKRGSCKNRTEDEGNGVDEDSLEKVLSSGRYLMVQLIHLTSSWQGEGWLVTGADLSDKIRRTLQYTAKFSASVWHLCKPQMVRLSDELHEDAIVMTR
jgi:hypothetical protein